MFRNIKNLITLYKQKNPHFIHVEFKFYKSWKLAIKVVMSLNKNYKACEIFRKKYKSYDNIVIIGLKWSGKNVKRRTSGYAKTFIANHSDPRCIYCNVKLTDHNATSDHIIPISEGGNNTQVNLVVCCKKCNGDRGNLKFKEYLKLRNHPLGSSRYPFI